MRLVDLGEIDGPLLIFGGAYSNLQATQALIDAAHRHDIAAQQCIFTGDSIAYCANPSETLDLLRMFGCHMIKGNCEIELSVGSDTCGCGFEPGSSCDVLSRVWYAYANKQISLQQRQFMGALPDHLTFHHHGKCYIVLHGGYHDISEFLFPTTFEKDFTSIINEIRGDIGAFDAIIAGHSGIPFTRTVDGVSWLNSGAIGMPAHNGKPSTSYAILDAGEFKIYDMTYDYNAAYNAMRHAGLDQGYHTALKTGYWPSEDVLPSDLRRAADKG